MRESLAKKRSARLAAVQTLYRADVLGSTVPAERLVEQTLEQWAGNSRDSNPDWEVDSPPDKALLRGIVAGVREHVDAIDEQMYRVIKENWSAERMGPVLRSLLRCAVWELAYTERKAPVLIDEYTTITSGFFDEPELGYMHSALQQLAAQLRPTADSNG